MTDNTEASLTERELKISNLLGVSVEDARALIAKAQKANEAYREERAATEQERRIAAAADVDVAEAHEAVERSEEERAHDFVERYRAKAAASLSKASFHEFFELAASLNSAGAALGVQKAVLDCATGEVSVTYRSR
jgi:hypothetical protein